MYDQLKWVAQIGLPALGALYFALASIWGLPYGEEVIGTITAVDLFLGVVLGISTKTYNASDAKYDGAMLVSPDGSGSLVFNAALSQLQTQPQITLKVTPTSTAAPTP